MVKIKEVFTEKLNVKKHYQNWKAKNQEKKQQKMQSDEMLDLTKKISRHKLSELPLWGIAAGIIVVLVIGYFVYNQFRVFHSYSTVSSVKREDISSTQYIGMGDNILKYSADGTSYINEKNEVLWSSTFSMQSPIVDISGTTAVVADQKGTQVYIFDENGQMGQFQTVLPIVKVKVASQGVVAAVLEESDTTWINFYDTKGNIIAKNRTSISDFGYPLDVALSPDGLKMMVSYLRIHKEKMSTKVAFYNFDSVGQTQINNEVFSTTYDNDVVPKILFMNNTTAAAYRSNGITIFKGKQIPEESSKIDIQQEIISIFHSDQYLGLVLKSDKPEHKYLMNLYNSSGKLTMEKYFDMDYKEIEIDGNQVLLLNEGKFMILSTGGKEIFQGSYSKPIISLMKTGGFRKYTIITQNSTDQIRLK